MGYRTIKDINHAWHLFKFLINAYVNLLSSAVTLQFSGEVPQAVQRDGPKGKGGSTQIAMSVQTRNGVRYVPNHGLMIEEGYFVSTSIIVIFTIPLYVTTLK